ncbi:Uncharacterised protein [Serratia marcescens]|uniref:Uncharacterized protein n=1 Tax=Serratia marcescens TaxID=615 RepID=A0A380ANF8_SERMA|nr:Uncharacterised protein [Serratia marcescens]
MTQDLFAAALQQAVDIARQAPSSHNCQPWSLHYDADARCGRLAIDRRRALQSLPSLEREMLMSCGIFFEYLSALLNCAGSPLAWRWENGPTHLLSFAPAAPAAPDRAAHRQLAQLIGERHTARAAYQPTPINEAQRMQLQTLFDGTASSLSIAGDERARRRVAQLTARHAALDFSDRQAWRETYQYIRFNERQPTDDGFHLHHLFGPVSPAFKRFFQVAFHPRLSRLATGLRLPALYGARAGATRRGRPAIPGAVSERRKCRAPVRHPACGLGVCGSRCNTGVGDCIRSAFWCNTPRRVASSQQPWRSALPRCFLPASATCNNGAAQRPDAVGKAF